MSAILSTSLTILTVPNILEFQKCDEKYPEIIPSSYYIFKLGTFKINNENQ